MRAADGADAVHLGAVAREVGAAEPDGDLRRQDDAARDVYPGASRRHEHPRPVAIGDGGDPAARRAPPARAARFAGLLAEAGRRAQQVIESFTETYGYRNALLFDPEGNTLLRFQPDLNPGPNLLTGPLRDSELAEVFDRVRTLLQVDLSDYQVYPGRSEPAAFIAGPVYDTQGRIGGYIALELGNREVFQTFTDYNGLGETGETVVASRDGDEMWFVSPLRHDPRTTSSAGA